MAEASGLIWVRSLGTLETRALPGRENAAGALFWSPDSRSLAFGVLPVRFRLKRVGISPRPPQNLSEAAHRRAHGSLEPPQHPLGCQLLVAGGDQEEFG